MENKSKSTSIVITIVILCVGAVTAIASAVFKNNPLQNPNNGNVSSENSSSPYKNGNYQVTQSYISPGGLEKFNLSLDLSNGVITSADFEGGSQDLTGQNFQSQFSQGFKQYVVGKNIDEVSLGVVSGASLTSRAFMLALESIKNQAANN